MFNINEVLKELIDNFIVEEFSWRASGNEARIRATIGSGRRSVRSGEGGTDFGGRSMMPPTQADIRAASGGDSWDSSSFKMVGMREILKRKSDRRREDAPAPVEEPAPVTATGEPTPVWKVGELAKESARGSTTERDYIKRQLKDKGRDNVPRQSFRKMSSPYAAAFHGEFNDLLDDFLEGHEVGKHLHPEAVATKAEEVFHNMMVQKYPEVLTHPRIKQINASNLSPEAKAQQTHVVAKFEFERLIAEKGNIASNITKSAAERAEYGEILAAPRAAILKAIDSVAALTLPKEKEKPNPLHYRGKVSKKKTRVRSEAPAEAPAVTPEPDRRSPITLASVNPYMSELRETLL